MTGLFDIIGLQSLLVLIFTFGVGYVVLFWTYRRAHRLHVWHDLSDFDKAMRTFIVGGVLSWIAFLLSNAPIDSTLPSDWWSWFTRSSGWFFLLIDCGMGILYLQSFLEGPKPPPPPTKDPLAEWLKTKWQNWKTENRLDKIDKFLGNAQTILAVGSLVFLLIGTGLNGQIYCDLSQAPQTTTLTVTPTSVTQSTASTCTLSPCRNNETLTDHLNLSESLSASCTRMQTLREAQETWQLKELLDNLGALFLVVFLFVTGIRRVAMKKRHQMEPKVAKS